MNKLKVLHSETTYINKCGNCNICCKSEEEIYLSVIDILRISEYTNVSIEHLCNDYLAIQEHRDLEIPLLAIKKENGVCKFKGGAICVLKEYKPEQCFIHPLRRNYVKPKDTQAYFTMLTQNCNIAKMNLPTITSLNQLLTDLEQEELINLTNRWFNLVYDTNKDYIKLKNRVSTIELKDTTYDIINILYSIDKSKPLDDNITIKEHYLKELFNKY